MYADNGTSSGAAIFGTGAIGVSGLGTTSGGAGGEFVNEVGGEGIRVTSYDGLTGQFTLGSAASANTGWRRVHFN